MRHTARAAAWLGPPAWLPRAPSARQLHSGSNTWLNRFKTAAAEARLRVWLGRLAGRLLLRPPCACRHTGTAYQPIWRGEKPKHLSGRPGWQQLPEQLCGAAWPPHAPGRCSKVPGMLAAIHELISRLPPPSSRCSCRVHPCEAVVLVSNRPFRSAMGRVARLASAALVLAVHAAAFRIATARPDPPAIAGTSVDAAPHAWPVSVSARSPPAPAAACSCVPAAM